ncbi:MAG: pilus assembly protein [Burkholderiaceae bacterium]|nr:pilus assembly protein [Burkholderiaceae bacterium]
MDKQDSQRGSAAIELAFSLILLLMLFFAIVSYGALFWAQQKISHLAGEGARTAVTAHFQGIEQAVEVGCSKVIAMQQDDFLLVSLGGFACIPSGPVPDSSGNGSARALAGVAACPFDANYQCATIIVSGQVRGWPLLDMMRELAGVFGSDASKLLPETLSAQAVVQI